MDTLAILGICELPPCSPSLIVHRPSPWQPLQRMSSSVRVPCCIPLRRPSACQIQPCSACISDPKCPLWLLSLALKVENASLRCIYLKQTTVILVPPAGLMWPFFASFPVCVRFPMQQCKLHDFLQIFCSALLWTHCKDGFAFMLA